MVRQAVTGAHVRTTIDTLKIQHGELRSHLARISGLVARGEVASLRTALAALKSVLLVHLELEDGTLYPAMARMTGGMKKTVQVTTAETYRLHMEGVSEALVAFLRRYDADFALADFAVDWPLVAKMLLDRMESEEETLYPMYEKWSDAGQ